MADKTASADRLVNARYDSIGAALCRAPGLTGLRRCEEAATGKSFCNIHTKFAKLYKRYKEDEKSLVKLAMPEEVTLSSVRELRENVCRYARCEQKRLNYMQKCIAKECWDEGHNARLEYLRNERKLGQQLVLDACKILRQPAPEKHIPDLSSLSRKVPDTAVETVAVAADTVSTISQAEIAAIEDFTDFTINWEAEKIKWITTFSDLSGDDYEKRAYHLIGLIYKAERILVEDCGKHKDENHIRRVLSISHELVDLVSERMTKPKWLPEIYRVDSIHLNVLRHTPLPRTHYIIVPTNATTEVIIAANIDYYILSSISFETYPPPPFASMLFLYGLSFEHYKDIMSKDLAKNPGGRARATLKLLEVCPKFDMRLAAIITRNDETRMFYYMNVDLHGKNEPQLENIVLEFYKKVRIESEYKRFLLTCFTEKELMRFADRYASGDQIEYRTNLTIRRLQRIMNQF